MEKHADGFHLNSNLPKYRNTDEYPDNLILALGILPSSDTARHNQQIEGLNMALESLSEIEQEILIERFRDLKTLQESADPRSVTWQYIQQLEKGALSKLKHPTRTTLIAYGPDTVKRYKNLQDEIEKMENHLAMLKTEIARTEEQLKAAATDSRKADIDQKKDWANISLEDMGLSSRAKYRLSHNNINNLYQLSQLSRADLCGIRLIGIVTVNEIIEKAAEYGVNIPEGD